MIFALQSSRHFGTRPLRESSASTAASNPAQSGFDGAKREFGGINLSSDALKQVVSSDVGHHFLRIDCRIVIEANGLL